MKVVLRNQYVVMTPMTFPIYLDGPVEGGGDWQVAFMQQFISSSNMWPEFFLKRTEPHILFFIPCKWDQDHVLSPYFVKNPSYLSEDGAEKYPKNHDQWDEYQKLVTLAHKGLVLYGLFPEDESKKRQNGVVYAFEQMLSILLFSTISNRINRDNHLIVASHKDFLRNKELVDFFRVNMSRKWFSERFKYVDSSEGFADFVCEIIRSSFKVF